LPLFLFVYVFYLFPPFSTFLFSFHYFLCPPPLPFTLFFFGELAFFLWLLFLVLSTFFSPFHTLSCRWLLFRFAFQLPSYPLLLIPFLWVGDSIPSFFEHCGASVCCRPQNLHIFYSFLFFCHYQLSLLFFLCIPFPRLPCPISCLCLCP